MLFFLSSYMFEMVTTYAVFFCINKQLMVPCFLFDHSYSQCFLQRLKW
jgi:hypothetical protein